MLLGFDKGSAMLGPPPESAGLTSTSWIYRLTKEGLVAELAKRGIVGEGTE